MDQVKDKAEGILEISLKEIEEFLQTKLNIKVDRFHSVCFGVPNFEYSKDRMIIDFAYDLTGDICGWEEPAKCYLEIIEQIDSELANPDKPFVSKISHQNLSKIYADNPAYPWHLTKNQKEGLTDGIDASALHNHDSIYLTAEDVLSGEMTLRVKNLIVTDILQAPIKHSSLQEINGGSYHLVENDYVGLTQGGNYDGHLHTQYAELNELMLLLEDYALKTDIHTPGRDVSLAAGTSSAVTALEIKQHLENNNNPHGVSAHQIGVYTAEEVDMALAQKSDTTHTHPNFVQKAFTTFAYGLIGAGHETKFLRLNGSGPYSNQSGFRLWEPCILKNMSVQCSAAASATFYVYKNEDWDNPIAQLVLAGSKGQNSDMVIVLEENDVISAEVKVQDGTVVDNPNLLLNLMF